MEVLSKKELGKIMLSIDSYNDDNLNTFTTTLSDYCEDISGEHLDGIVEYVEDELDISSDSELKEISEDDIAELCDFINEIAS